MEKLLIHGQRPLCGQVSINGAKNAALAIIAASLLADDIVTLENIPDIDDIKNLVMVLEKMNVRTTYLDKHTLRIDSRYMSGRCELPTIFSARFWGDLNARASRSLADVILGSVPSTSISRGFRPWALKWMRRGSSAFKPENCGEPMCSWIWSQWELPSTLCWRQSWQRVPL